MGRSGYRSQGQFQKAEFAPVRPTGISQKLHTTLGRLLVSLHSGPLTISRYLMQAPSRDVQMVHAALRGGSSAVAAVHGDKIAGMLVM